MKRSALALTLLFSSPFIFYASASVAEPPNKAERKAQKQPTPNYGQIRSEEAHKQRDMKKERQEIEGNRDKTQLERERERESQRYREEQTRELQKHREEMLRERRQN
ncbi:hypothetical protein QCB44_08060 [Thiomicrorhabdus sp. zzn3]|uniref:hypothetical protein n=1 Tax=Thiomicrorhabdus sp. zzn3 TaxID=3039775 RepID=UPI0024364721|nr:hypothetical protein [Thiomicrorhabdus sp. zzn3]MDG6778657.1 hypothetical protein [Thiomicrorhabdus sp. zzn3]